MAILWIILTQLVCVYLCTGKITNVALNKPVNMSSRLRSDLYPAENGVDGITKEGISDFVHTSTSRSMGWWMVDLRTLVRDAPVKIYFRTDYKWKRNGVQLYTSRDPFSSYPGGQLCHTVTGSADGTNIPNVISVNCSGSWRYLMVYTNTSNDGQGPLLDFSEVEVFGCSKDTYGSSCVKPCSFRHCIEPSETCDSIDGACPGGCQAGWMGTDCRDVCPLGTFGTNCFPCSTRHCKSMTECPDDGVCVGGCEDGWMLDNCTQACPSGTYGPDCSSTCGNCAGDTICHHSTGICTGDCGAGWIGAQCKQVNGSEGMASVTVGVIGVLIGVIVTLAVVGGLCVCLIRQGSLQWNVSKSKEPQQSAEMTESRVQQIQSNTPVAQSDIDEVHYSVLDGRRMSDKTYYDVIDKKYQNM